MRPTLCNLLRSRYPDLHMRHGQSPCRFSIWFWIIGAFSEALLTRDSACCDFDERQLVPTLFGFDVFASDPLINGGV
jgi:hypothetical protein